MPRVIRATLPRGVPEEAAQRRRGVRARPPAALVVHGAAAARPRRRRWCWGVHRATASRVAGHAVDRRRLSCSAVVWFVFRYAEWVTTNFVVTTDRVIYRSGVLAKHGIEIPLERINTVFFDQSIFERVLGRGRPAIESAGETGTEFSDIRRPSFVQNEIYRQMEENENRKFDRIGHRFPGRPPVGSGSLSMPRSSSRS